MANCWVPIASAGRAGAGAVPGSGRALASQATRSLARSAGWGD
jgi:hypothetical protein